MFWLKVGIVIALLLVAMAVYGRIKNGDWKSRGYNGRGHRSDQSLGDTAAHGASVSGKKNYQNRGGGMGPGSI